MTNIIEGSLRTAIINHINVSLKKILPKRSELKRILTHRQRSRMAAIIARSFMKQRPGQYSLSTAMRAAWCMVKYYDQHLRIVKFEKVNGSITQRVVFTESWSKFYQIKGTGRKLKEGQVLFVDVAKYAINKDRATISTYLYNIIETV